jgi:hypothetical protein
MAAGGQPLRPLSGPALAGWNLSARPAHLAAVLHHLVRPRASLRARLAEPQLRRVPCRRPRPVTHVMPGICVVLIPVTPFIAAFCPGELRAAERADLLAAGAECYGDRFVCHLRDPLRRCWPCAWPGGPCVVVAAAPAARRAVAVRDAVAATAYAPPGPRHTCPARRKAHSRSGGCWPGGALGQMAAVPLKNV